MRHQVAPRAEHDGGIQGNEQRPKDAHDAAERYEQGQLPEAHVLQAQHASCAGFQQLEQPAERT